MSGAGNFHSYWREWEQKLRGPIARSGSKLIFPALKQSNVDGYSVFQPAKPVGIYNAPQKSSSKKRGSSHKQTILIDGSFRLRTEDGSPSMVSGACNVTIFDTKEEPNTSVRMMPVEFVHFDMESYEAPTPYHPIFHVQRGMSNKLTDAIVKDVVFEFTKVDRTNISIDTYDHLYTPYLRMPTPQMDMFSVFALIIADFFSNSGDTNPNVREQFQSVLKYLRDSKNKAREGFASQLLHKRCVDAAYTSCAHWYPEYA